MFKFLPVKIVNGFIDAIKTAQVPDDHKLVSFDVKSLFTSIPLQLALDCTETAINNSTLQLPLLTNDLMDLLNLCLTSTYFQYNGQHYKQLHGTAMGSPVSVVVAEIVMQNIKEQYHSGYATLTILSQLYTKTKSTIFTNIPTDKTPTFSLPRRSRTMVRFLFLTACSFVTTTDYRRRFTENPPTLTDSLTNHLTTLRHTRLQQYGP